MTGSHLDTLRSARVAPMALWHKYVTLRARHPEDLFLFVEGRDDFSYYTCHVRPRWLIGQVQPIDCKGKDGVLGVLRQCTATGSSERALFFCDKDLDDLLKIPIVVDPKLYVTSVYSVECYLASIEAIRVVWTDHYSMELSDSRLEGVLKSVARSHDVYRSWLLTLMAWILWLRESGVRPNLGDVDIGKMIRVEVVGDAVHVRRASPRMSYLRRLCQVPCSVSPRGVVDVRRRLSRLDFKSYARGKFDLWFYIEVVRQLGRLSASEEGGRERPRSVVPITHSNAVALVSPRMPAPTCLSQFLTSALSLEVASGTGGAAEHSS